MSRSTQLSTLSSLSASGCGVPRRGLCALALGGAALLLLLGPAGPARADCSGSWPFVSCTGDDDDGLSRTFPGYIVIVDSDAKVDNSGGVGIDVGSENTVSNSGSIGTDEGVETGISVNNNNTILNSGTIEAVGTYPAAGTGISGGNNNSIFNYGSITTEVGEEPEVAPVGDHVDPWPVTGGIVEGSYNSIYNDGTIDAADYGIVALDGNTITNDTGGKITAGEVGIVANNGNTITNNGTIDPTTGMDIGSNNVVVNNGSIGADVTGILGDDYNTITNYGDIVVDVGGTNTDDIGIEVRDYNSILNADSIQANEDGIVARHGNTIENLGSINAGEDGIEAGIQNSIQNNGLIIAGEDGIFAGQENTITNLGSISAGNGAGIEAGNLNSIQNSGTITSGNDRGISAGTENTITNVGSINADTGGISATNSNTISNVGTIDGSAYGIAVGGNNSVANTGSIGGNIGITANGNANTITNTGSIGVSQGAIFALSNSSVVNEAAGTITGATGIAAVNSNTIENAGSIAATGDAIEVGNSNSIANSGTIVSSSDDGIEADGNSNTIANSGSINAGDDGIRVRGDLNDVSNTGTIVAGDDGIRANNNSTVSNAGSIDAAEAGIQVGDNNSVTNTGTIDPVTGIEAGSNNTVTNDNVIEAEATGILGADGNIITNSASGTITVGDDDTNTNDAGISVADANTVTNEGLIVVNASTVDNDGIGIAVSSGNTVSNSGTVEALRGIFADGSNNTIDNSGTIDTADEGIETSGGANSIVNSGVIDSANDGIEAGGGANTVVNSGTITTTTEDAIRVYGDGNDVSNTGTIVAGDDGIRASNNSTISNAGSIDAVEVGIRVDDGNVVTNTGTIDPVIGIELGSNNSATNDGTIDADVTGILGVNGNTIVNSASGTITSDSGDAFADDAGIEIGDNNSVTNEGTIVADEIGINATGGGNTIDNFGAITGGSLSIYGGTGATDVTNRSGGVMNGDIDLAEGDDVLRLETSSTLNNALTDGGDGTGDVVYLVNAEGEEASSTEAGSYDGRFANFELLYKEHAGTWTLSGGTSGTSSQVTNSWINGGTLLVDGYLQTDATINPAGTLGGNGTIEGDVTNNGGTIAPGTSIGTLTVDGDYTETAASTHAFEIDALGNNDLLNMVDTVSGTGTHTLFGGDPGSTLEVTAHPGDYSAGAEIYDIVIVAADGNRSGTFDPDNHTLLPPAPTPPDDDWRPKLYLEYLPDRIRLSSISKIFGEQGETQNQRRTGWYLDSLIPEGICESDLCFVANELTFGGDIPGDLDKLHPEVYDAYITAGFAQARLFAEEARNRMGVLRRGPLTNLASAPGGAELSAAPREPFQLASLGTAGLLAAGQSGIGGVTDVEEEGRFNVWGRAIGGYGDKDNTRDHIGYDFWTFGGVVGGDMRIGDNVLLGVMGGWLRTEIDWDKDRGEEAIANVGYGALYASYYNENLLLDAVVGYGRNWFDTKREIDIGRVDRTAESDHDGNQYFWNLAAAYRFGFAGGWGIEPTAQLDWVLLDHEAFVEDGGGAVSLSVDDRDEQSLRSLLGFRVSKIFDLNESLVLVPEVRGGWSHEYLDDERDITSSFAGVSQTFTVEGDNPKRDGVVMGLGCTLNIRERTSVYTQYSGDFRSNLLNHGVTLGARIRFH